MTRGAVSRPCPACGQPLVLVWVHGHGQCSACGINVVPCCSGTGDEVDVREPGAASAAIDALIELVRELGLVREEDLLNGFSARTGCGWEVGRELLREALRSGRVQRTPGDLIRLVPD